MADAAFQNLIDGRWVPARSGKTFEIRNPADRGDVIGDAADSDESEVDSAVAAARRAYDEWRLIPAPRRAEHVLRAAGAIEGCAEELSRLLARETGKTLAEARDEVREAVSCAVFCGGEGRLLSGQTTPAGRAGNMAMSVRMPVGVCGIITPWNSPVAVLAWKLFPALVCGNTAVLKPAEEAPGSAGRFCQILTDARLPNGVVNLVHGSGPRVGAPLVAHPDVTVISFTGSSEAGRDVAGRCGKLLKRVLLEPGGSNAQIVLDDADLDLATEGALWGAFGAAGQRCTSTRRLILHRKIAGNLTERLGASARSIRIGNGLDESTQMGPLINEAARKRVAHHVEVARKEGAELVCGGSPVTGKEFGEGFFFEPTVFAGVRPSMRIAREEILGPVLSILTVDSFEEAIQVQNDVPYGLSSSIYTQDVNRAMRAIRDIEAGVTYVNGPTIGEGVDSGSRRRDPYSTALDAFSEWKTVFVDYSGKPRPARAETL